MKNFFCGAICCGILSIIHSAYAQEPLRHEKRSYVDTLGRYYQQAELPVYIYIGTAPNQAPTLLLPNEGTEPKPIYLDGHGKHYLKHTDALHQSEDKFAIYADGLSPVSRLALVNAPIYTRSGRIYYGRGLQSILTTTDEMSGIQQLYHSLNQNAYTPYTGTMNYTQEGDFVYKFYAVDNVGNVEKPQSYSFTVDLSTPKTYHNIVGINSNNIISTSTKIYLSPTDSIAGVARTYYRFNNEAEKLYTPKSMLSFTYLPDGEHTLTYYSIDHVNNREEERTTSFYLDKSSPIMSADILGDRFIVGDRVYFSGRTKLKLTAVDNKSGIKEIKYSVDNKPFEQYQDPFYLPSVAGLHTIRYYAVDNMGNEGVGNDEVSKFDEYRHSVGVVYVDLTGPALSQQFVGPKFLKGDTIFISAQTNIQLQAYDPESGLQKITYSIDGDMNELPYSQAFRIEKGGYHKVDYFGYDNVNNRNVKDFQFVVDNTPPQIGITFSNSPIERAEERPVYPSYVSVFLSATDIETGIEDIKYSLNGGREQAYTGIIKNLERNKNYTLRITSTDKLGNVGVREVQFRTAKY